MTIRIDQVVTRGGDKGRTSLGNGARVSKDDARVEAYGTVDECNAVLGVMRAILAADTVRHQYRNDSALRLELDAVLERIQHGLFDLGGDLCVPRDDLVNSRLDGALIDLIEHEIERLLASQAPLDGFVLPGGSSGAAAAHHWRTVLRRAERRVVTLAAAEPVHPLVLRTLNRLSDYAFVLARHLNDDGREDVVWRPVGERPREHAGS